MLPFLIGLIFVGIILAVATLISLYLYRSAVPGRSRFRRASAVVATDPVEVREVTDELVLDSRVKDDETSRYARTLLLIVVIVLAVIVLMVITFVSMRFL